VSIASPVELRPARDLRIAGGALVGAAAIWPILPLHPPLACPLRTLTGIPCPFCGMTRACVAAVHGHLGTSLSFNPAGILVVLLAVTALLRPQLLVRARPPIWLISAGLGVLWLWNIGFNPTFHQWLR
jgi:hypothetical protein